MAEHARMRGAMPPLRELRRLKGWTLRDLAREAKVSADTLNDYEQRKPRLPRPRTMKRIADALGVSIASVDEFREAGRGTAERTD